MGRYKVRRWEGGKREQKGRRPGGKGRRLGGRKGKGGQERWEEDDCEQGKGKKVGRWKGGRYQGGREGKKVGRWKEEDMKGEGEGKKDGRKERRRKCGVMGRRE